MLNLTSYVAYPLEIYETNNRSSNTGIITGSVDTQETIKNESTEYSLSKDGYTTRYSSHEFSYFQTGTRDEPYFNFLGQNKTREGTYYTKYSKTEYQGTGLQTVHEWHGTTHRESYRYATTTRATTVSGETQTTTLTDDETYSVETISSSSWTEGTGYFNRGTFPDYSTYTTSRGSTVDSVQSVTSTYDAYTLETSTYETTIDEVAVTETTTYLATTSLSCDSVDDNTTKEQTFTDYETSSSVGSLPFLNSTYRVSFNEEDELMFIPKTDLDLGSSYVFSDAYDSANSFSSYNERVTYAESTLSTTEDEIGTYVFTASSIQPLLTTITLKALEYIGDTTKTKQTLVGGEYSTTTYTDAYYDTTENTEEVTTGFTWVSDSTVETSRLHRTYTTTTYGFDYAESYLTTYSNDSGINDTTTVNGNTITKRFAITASSFFTPLHYIDYSYSSPYGTDAGNGYSHYETREYNATKTTINKLSYITLSEGGHTYYGFNKEYDTGIAQPFSFTNVGLGFDSVDFPVGYSSIYKNVLGALPDNLTFTISDNSITWVTTSSTATSSPTFTTTTEQSLNTILPYRTYYTQAGVNLESNVTFAHAFTDNNIVSLKGLFNITEYIDTAKSTYVSYIDGTKTYNKGDILAIEPLDYYIANRYGKLSPKIIDKEI
ncbi:hypothetical protein P0Y35_11830 [Kiritimatiellaeota bacterium B1221]|nr:hypothetical protein [Kiritimatiellaeota bacterium B1221]